ncbi:transposase [Alteromonas lipotrueae]|uniref:transposase n=1 Tax=Alteromonas lipotrueae TaxID=2803814 RepID=UPI001C45EF20|nr:transposase [Alteromonas lipotrueae]
MAKIGSAERVVEYSLEFKIRVVKLTLALDVKAKDVASVLGLHPIMIYRWRQEYRADKFEEKPTRRISMTKETSDNNEELSKDKEIAQLKRALADAQKENNFLKKWDGYLKEQSQKNSRS